MIGWSSRDTRKRRQRWWDSLTEAEKALELRREKVADRVFFQALGIILSLLVLMLLIPSEWRQWLDRHRGVMLTLFLAIWPGGLVIAAFIAIYKRRRVK